MLHTISCVSLFYFPVKLGSLYELNESTDSLLGDYQILVTLAEIVMYVSTALVALITVAMNCNKMLQTEKKNLGIYRALGFTGSKLRLQFAFRFLIVSALGTLAGVALNFLLANRVLGALMHLIGMAFFKSSFSVAAILPPLMLVWVAFFAFAFLLSGKVKRLDVRELITE